MIGQTVSHYEILEKLGAGGMGVVYKARDTKLDRIVALKFLAAHLLESDKARNRFLQEARAISAMNHPSIAIVYEANDANGEPFLALEYLAGGTLRNKITNLRAKGLAVPIGEAVDLSLQLAEGLAHAHNNQVLHRDIKPGNLMFNAEGKLKITDFGLARFTSGPHITKGGVLLGTAPYMSPEQAKGLEIDQRSDLFAAGAVMYEMLCGEPPFHAAEESEVVQQIIHSKTPLEKLPPEIPDSLRAVIRHLLEKDRDQRYQRADDMVLDLRAVQRSLEGPTSALTSRVPSYARKRPLSRRMALVLACVLVAMLVAAIAAKFLFFPHLPVPGRKHIAVLQFENVGGDPANGAFCEGLVETVTSSLTQLEQFHDTLLVVPASEVRRQAIRSAADARRAFNVNLVITGSVERSEGLIRLHTNLVDTQSYTQIASRSMVSPLAELNQLQDRVVREVAGLMELQVQPPAFHLLAAGNTSSASAYDLYLKARGYLDRYDKPGNLDQAIELLKTALARDPGYSLAYAALSEANWQKYGVTHEPNWLSEAEQLGLRAIELNKLVPTAAHVNLGRVYSTTGRYADAVREYQAALHSDPVSVAAYQGLADVYRVSARPKQAEAVYQQAIKLRPNDWLSYTMLGTFYYEQSRYADSEDPFRRVTELTPDNYLAWYNLGALHLTLGKYDVAATEFRRSLGLKEGPGGYLGLAAVFSAQGRFRESAETNEKALALGTNSYVAAGNLADSYRWTPELAAKAPEMYRRAIENADRALIINPKDAYALASRAVYWAKIGNNNQALEDIGKARGLAPADARFVYRWALIQEVARHREQALKGLADALRAGYSFEEINRDPELAELRRDPRFDRLAQLQRVNKPN